MEEIQAIEIDRGSVALVSAAAATASLVPDRCICPEFGLPRHQENEHCGSRKLITLQNELAPPLSVISVGLQSWLESNKDFRITDNTAYERWWEALGRLRGVKKTFEEQRLSITRPIDSEKESIMDLFRPVLGASKAPGYIDQVDKVISDAIVLYDAQKRAEKAKAELEAQKVQQVFREEGALHTAEKLERAGDSQGAQRHLELAVSRPASQIRTASNLPAVSGGGVKAKIEWRIRDPHELVNKIRAAVKSARETLAASDCDPMVDDAMVYVAELLETFGPLLVLDEGLVRQRINAFGIKAGIPGVEIEQGSKVPARARR